MSAPTDEQLRAYARATYRHVQGVQTRLTEVIVRLNMRSLAHDRSKINGPEQAGLAILESLRETTPYGSPEYAAALEAQRPALEAHYRTNDHHPEHYPGGIEDMSLLALIEMLCDWHEASGRHPGGSFARSLAVNQHRYRISPQLMSVLVATGRELGWLTEQEAADVGTRYG